MKAVNFKNRDLPGIVREYNDYKSEYENKYIYHMIDLLPENGSFREVGCWQAMPCAFMMVNGRPSYVEAVDVDLSKINAIRSQFEAYAEENDIELAIVESGRSAQMEGRPVDITFIDAEKSYRYVREALDVHSKLTRLYIKVDDTSFRDDVKTRDAVMDFLEENEDWEFFHENTQYPGQVTIKKVK